MSIGFWIKRKKAALKKAKAATTVEQTKASTETPKKAKKGGVKSDKTTD